MSETTQKLQTWDPDDKKLVADFHRLLDLVVHGDRATLLHGSPMFRILDELGGKPGHCKACGVRLWWFTTRANARQVPVTERAVVHFVDCPKAAEFRRGKA